MEARPGTAGGLRSAQGGGRNFAGLTFFNGVTSGNPERMSQDAETPRLFLVTPVVTDAEAFTRSLAEALAAADIAAVLISPSADERSYADLAAKLVPIIQAAGAAALIADDTRIVGRAKADGVHIATGLADLRTASRSLRPRSIVGAGSINSRHAAMEAGEEDIDYVFFGAPHGDTHAEAHPKTLDLAEWWSDLMSIPAVTMAGLSLDSVAEAAATGAAFVGLHAAVWKHDNGPAAAVRAAAARLKPVAALSA